MKAVLIICEGRSDIAFVRRSLKALASCKEFDGGIGDLPTPFGTIPSTSKSGTTLEEGYISQKGVIARHIEMCSKDKPMDDRRLSGAASLSPPQFDAAIWNKEENVIYLFVNAGGRDQHNGVIKLLEKVDDSISIINQALDLDIKEYATSFLFDANYIGKIKVIEDFVGSYHDYFGCLSDVDHKCWTQSKRCPVGLYIFCDEAGKGALENYIVKMTQSIWPERHKGAGDFICQNKKHGDKVSKTETNKLKAIITSVGQFNFPGDSLFSVINDGSKGIPDERFRKLPACKDLVNFFQNVPWGD